VVVGRVVVGRVVVGRVVVGRVVFGRVVVGRVVVGRVVVVVFPRIQTRGCQCSFGLLMMGGMSSETS
jgi:hypothetical protein